MPFRTEQFTQRLSLLAPVAMAIILSLSGCFAPLRSHGIPASHLPDSFRDPVNIHLPEINISSLVSPPPTEYLLGPGDVLEIIIPDLFGETSFRPLRAQVQDNGFIQLPRVGSLMSEATRCKLPRRLSIILWRMVFLLIQPRL